MANIPVTRGERVKADPAKTAAEIVSGSAEAKARKHPTRTGRPVTKEESKLAPFNLPLRVIQMLQDAADEHAAGNKSKFVQDAIENYIKSLQKG